jgi:hypothetical protein
MFLTFSAASAVSVSDLSEPGCEPSRSAKSIRSAAPFSENIGRQSPATTTLELSEPQTCGQMSFAEGFLASHSAQPAPGGAAASAMTVSSGRKCCALFRNASPLGSLVRMLLELNRWHSDKWFLTWKAQDTKSRRRLKFRLVPSDTITGGRASGFSHTPTCAVNMGAPSMQKHLCCRGLLMTPEEWERRMGFPIGWTAVEWKPSATLSFRRSPKSSGGRS